jgi:hypothetical protein
MHFKEAAQKAQQAAHIGEADASKSSPILNRGTNH